MTYLESFRLPSEIDEDSFILSYPKQFEMQCYSNNNAYPFKIFPKKKLTEITFEPITVIYGGNGSGKSTLLNVIAQKLGAGRSAPWSDSACMEPYLDLCSYKLSPKTKAPPRDSLIITSDDVFDFLLDIRTINEGIDRKRNELFEEYYTTRKDMYQPLRSLDELEEFKRHNDARMKTKSSFVSRRLPKELEGKSNGESAYIYFTQKIKENAIYLLDEPENSLSAVLQRELAKFIEDSVRFYGCQFIISTHSPFLLSLMGAKIYDLDSVPAMPRKWHELENVRMYFELFEKHRDSFK